LDHEPLNNRKSLPINAMAVYTMQSGWELVADVVAERDRLWTAIDDAVCKDDLEAMRERIWREIKPAIKKP
jgi:hypothetical protein